MWAEVDILLFELFLFLHLSFYLFFTDLIVLVPGWVCKEFSGPPSRFIQCVGHIMSSQVVGFRRPTSTRLDS